jgi:hypothetical protein
MQLTRHKMLNKVGANSSFGTEKVKQFSGWKSVGWRDEIRALSHGPIHPLNSKRTHLSCQSKSRKLSKMKDSNIRVSCAGAAAMSWMAWSTLSSPFSSTSSAEALESRSGFFGHDSLRFGGSLLGSSVGTAWYSDFGRGIRLLSGRRSLLKCKLYPQSFL